MERPRVSTVIPSYNRARMIEGTIDSVIAQTYPAELHEIVVVDDGSQDDTAAVVGRYGARVRYVAKPNGGVSSARNLGARASSGELLAFLDSDDRWLPHKIERQVELLSTRRDLGLIVTDVEVVSDSAAPVHIRRRRDLPRDGASLPDVMRSPKLWPSSAMVRRSVFDAVGGFDESLRTAEDLDFHLNVASVTGIGLVEEPLTQYRVHGDNLSDELSTYDTYVHVIERFTARHPELARRLREETLSLAYARNARGLLGAGEYRAGLRYAAKAVRHARGGRELKELAMLARQLVRTTASRTLRRIAGRRPSGDDAPGKTSGTR